MRTVLIAFVAMLFPGAATAGDWYLHSGSKPCNLVPQECSLMSAGFMDSGEFIIAYSRPRPGLASIGIEAGTPLITGSIVGGWFAGKARRFKRYGSLTCTLEYAVSGMIAPGATIVLEGAAPIFARNRCASVGTTWDDEQARLTFYYVGSGQSPSVSFR